MTRRRLAAPLKRLCSMRSFWVGVLACAMHTHVMGLAAEQVLTGCPARPAGEPGNEAGYVVKMTDDTLEKPYKIAPGTRVRVESAYDGNTRRLGAAPRTHALLSARALLVLLGAGWMCAGSMAFNKHAPQVGRDMGAYVFRGSQSFSMCHWLCLWV